MVRASGLTFQSRTNCLNPINALDAPYLKDGARVRSYHAWTLLDKFEWADGFSQRYGLTYVASATNAERSKIPVCGMGVSRPQNHLGVRLGCFRRDARRCAICWDEDSQTEAKRRTGWRAQDGWLLHGADCTVFWTGIGYLDAYLSSFVRSVTFRFSSSSTTGKPSCLCK